MALEPRDVIQIRKLRDSRYSPRMYYFNVDENSASLEDMRGKPAAEADPDEETA
jgi:hypothetical protein